MTTAATPPADTAGTPRPCNRCKEHEGTIDLRGAEIVCEACFAYYISSKAIKRLEALQRDPATPRLKGPGGQRRPQRYLVGLSCGPSSTALLHVLTENVRQQRARGQKTARFEYIAVHVVDDTSTPFSSSPLPSSTTGSNSAEDSDSVLASYRTHFPEADLLSVPLSSALTLPSIDWTALPPLPNPTPTELSPAQQLSDIFHRLPSATSRADVRRLLTRHLLIATAVDRKCDALLLGHSTTSLAELTLSETAKGRGFSLPWLVNDGAVRVPDSLTLAQAQAQAQAQAADSDSNANTPAAAARGPGKETGAGAVAAASLPVYSPLRELFRKELVLYLSRVSPALLDILAPTEAAGITKNGGAVVSHRDLSIDDVLARYFGEVEASYPSVVANVVRTTGKLLRRPDADTDAAGHDHGGKEEGNSASNSSSSSSTAGGGGNTCGLCGAALDELGDERWRGEIGDDNNNNNGEEANCGLENRPRLCYGCERSIHG
ncbi:hypothetical protein K449DRAFT_352739 [Hypoxylon sp. EC38]|nr:hypothetical protein K449DRAFT_352739 [Hypoxylon sp. EC38]